MSDQSYVDHPAIVILRIIIIILQIYAYKFPRLNQDFPRSSFSIINKAIWSRIPGAFCVNSVDFIEADPLSLLEKVELK